MSLIQGHCVEPREDQLLHLNPGEYGRDLKDGFWYCFPPGFTKEQWMMGNLRNHVITVHEDGTITAAPSIKITGGGLEWHGYLEHGMWRLA